MAVEKQVNIRVTETGLDEINKDLTSLDKNINKVEGSSKEASKGLKGKAEQKNINSERKWSKGISNENNGNFRPVSEEREGSRIYR